MRSMGLTFDTAVMIRIRVAAYRLSLFRRDVAHSAKEALTALDGRTLVRVLPFFIAHVSLIDNTE